MNRMSEELRNCPYHHLKRVTRHEHRAKMALEDELV